MQRSGACSKGRGEEERQKEVGFSDRDMDTEKDMIMPLGFHEW